MDNVKLVIVESPNKIKKIQSLLGNGYKVMASIGHIRGLPQKQLGVHRQEAYRLDYEIDEAKKNVIGSLVAETKKLGKTNVLLATDPDREGEAIAFHLAEILGLNKDQACRVMFHELTQKAIQKAIGQPTKINFQLVKAQEARRAIDRLAGFEVSQVLNHKLKKNGTESYSAGRVQSPALKLIVEREREIAGFTPVLKYKLKASFLTPVTTAFNRDKIVATQVGGEALNKEDILFYFQDVASHSFYISKVEKLQSFRNPAPAFTTSTLQQDAIKKFKWGAKKVMEVAQSLFEQGHITYMRTDSPNLSEEAISEIEQQLITVGKSSKFKKTTYTAKGNAQEAHEAIRPTHFDARTAGENEEQQKLYSLIYLRAIASQMIPAEYSNDKISILDQTDGKLFESNKRSLVEAGFLEMYNDASEEDEEEEIGSSIHGKIAVGDELTVFDMTGKGMYSNPPKRYDEAGLVKELEKRGIGRPSTYAAILNQVIAIKEYAFPTTIAPIIKEIEVIQLNHEFKVSSTVEKQSIGGDKNKLIPSEHGLAIIDFLNANFSRMMDYQFTSDIEAQLDEVVEGKANYLDVMQGFDSTHITSLKECEALPEVNVSERKTTLLGQLEGHPVSYGKTEKGAYLLHQNVFYNLSDETIPDLARAEVIIKQLKEKKALSLVHQVKDLVVKNGQYGYYIEDKKGNKAPLKMELDAIKQLDYQELSEKLKSYLAWKKNKR